ncbi:MAG: transglutaminase domain-containing protein [Planctomycetes bacterium]|nr:transglutaminase domain-containing protein [Planctomycetota bacterium]
MNTHLSILSIAALALLATSCTYSGKQPMHVEGTVTYVSTIEDIPSGSSRVRAWVPVPTSTPFQTVTNLTYEPATAKIAEEPQYGNRILYLEQQASGSGPVEIRVSFDVLRQKQVAASEQADGTLMTRHLEPDRLGIIDKRIEDMSAEAVAGHGTTMAKARAIYDYVLEHMDYDKKTPGWGHGDTARACDVGKGNCSDYHSLFISMARAANIPARFHYGLALKPNGKAGPHCWAAFHDEKLGWVPVDISEADKDPSKTEFYFGNLSTNRVELTTGRDINLSPRQTSASLNFFIAPHVEVDGKLHEAVSYKTSHVSDAFPKALN